MGAIYLLKSSKRHLILKKVSIEFIEKLHLERDSDRILIIKIIRKKTTLGLQLWRNNNEKTKMDERTCQINFDFGCDMFNNG